MTDKTLRLHMPQWQGGNVDAYFLSSQVLSWLLPPADGPEEWIAVPEADGALVPVDGMLAKPALLDQARMARAAIERHLPDRIVTIGGDCLVDLAPIAWLNARYGGRLGVLWIDAHPDVQTRAETDQGNAQVLGMLLGRGDPDFVAEVPVPLDPDLVLYAGLDQWSDAEARVIDTLGLARIGAKDLSGPRVRDWIMAKGITHLAVHLDVDAIAPERFRPMLFNKPGTGPEFLAGVPRGGLAPAQIAEALQAAGEVCKIAGLALTEYISWDAVETRALLARLPILSG